MVIYLDSIIYSLQKQGGISIYWTELIKRASFDKEFDFKIIVRKNYKKNYNYDSISNIPIKNILSIVPIYILRFLPFFYKLSEKIIYHTSYLNFIFSKKALNVITIHDLGYERNISQKGFKKSINLFFKYFTLLNADAIICISNFTKNELIHFYPFCSNKINVIYNGVSNDFYKLPNVNECLIDKSLKYLIFIGARYEYKQFDLTIKVLENLPNYHLVIVGGGSLKKEEKIQLNKSVKKRYVHFITMTNQNLNILYNNAHALLYLSKYEGFGIPIIESMRSGCPFIALNNSSIPEIADNAGIILKAQNSNLLNDICDAVLHLENMTTRNNIIEKGLKRSKLFSWDICYEQTKLVYKNLEKNFIPNQ